ncbi:MAG: T9SS type A sorting domain-containing protein, partial [Ignavibacteria bacterium]
QYNIYRADSYQLTDLPVDYTLIKSIFIDTNLTPEFIDSLNPASCNGSNINGGALISRYMITAVDNSAWESVKSDFSSIALSNIPIGINLNGKQLPNSFSLLQNYPNPFNPVTIIGYNVPKTGTIKLVVYDITGKEVRTLVDGEIKAGSYNVVFNGGSLASGIYIYRFISGDFSATRKMVLIK